MNKDEKMFVCVRQSKFAFHISPRTRAGWIATALWLGLILAVAGLYTFALMIMDAIGYNDEQTIIYTLIPFFIIVFIIIIIMIRWMYNRSEVINANDITQWKNEKDSKKTKAGRSKRTKK